MGSLYCERMGQGQALVLLHGWGMHGGVWQNFARVLSEHFDVYIIDLPGFGHSPWLGELGLAQLAAELACMLPRPAIWLGWSLGGLVAQQVALSETHKVSHLITLSSTACFCAKSQWPGVAPHSLEALMAALQENADKTLTRFIKTQALGSMSARSDIKHLQEHLHSRPKANTQALSWGLNLLKNSDLSAKIAQITVPWLQLYGQHDTLIPIAAMQAHARINPHAKQHCFVHSSHMPFISEREGVCKCIEKFVFGADDV